MSRGIQSPFNQGADFPVLISETGLPFYSSHGIDRSASGCVSSGAWPPVCMYTNCHHSEPTYTPVWSFLTATSPSVMSELHMCMLAVPFHPLYLSITLWMLCWSPAGHVCKHRAWARPCTFLTLLLVRSGGWNQSGRKYLHHGNWQMI